MKTNRRLPRIYFDSSCFVEIAKHAVGTGEGAWDDNIRHLDVLLKEAREGRLEILTATLTIAECSHASEPGDTGMPSDKVKSVFKTLLTSGQYVLLVQDTVLVAEKARNLRWVHGIKLGGADSVHAASALEMDCDEFLAMDKKFICQKDKFNDVFSLRVCLPKNTHFMPPKPKEPEEPAQLLLLPPGE